MKILFDLLPVAAFFAVFKIYGIFAATAVAIAITVLQIGWEWWRRRKIEAMQWISLGVITVFGGATLLLHDETYIKLKPTVLYWLITLSLVIALYGFGKNPMRAMLDKQLALPNSIWAWVNNMWAGFFAVMGGLNLYVAHNFTTDTWVNFKLFGFMGLMFVFVIAQGVFLSRYIKDDAPENG